jgi:hypothetical protein
MKKVFFAFVVTSMVVLSSCGDKNKSTDAATTVNQDSIDKAKAMQATAPKDTISATKDTTTTTTTTTTTEKK